MRILRLELKNFKPFKDLSLPEEGDLPEGLILIRGPNSTGKSSLFEAMLWGLWGSAAVALNNEELISFTSSFCKVIIEFDVDGTKYKIDRSYDSANGMAVILYVWKKNVWRRIADKTRTVERKIEEIFNLQLDQGLNTLLVRQGEVAMIANATPAVLRELLIRVYNIELLNQMSTHLENLESDLAIRISSLEADYVPPGYIREQIESSRANLDSYKKELDSRAKELAEAKERLNAAPDVSLLDKIEEFHSKVIKLTSNYAGREGDLKKSLSEAGLVDTDAQVIRARIDYLERESERLKSQRKELEEQIQHLDIHTGGVKGMISELSEVIETLEKTEETDSEQLKCPTCSKPLKPQERDELLLDYKARITEGEGKIRDARTQRTKLQADVKKIDDRVTMTIKAIEAVKRAQSIQESLKDSKRGIEAAQEELQTCIEKTGADGLDELLAEYGVNRISELQREVGVLKSGVSSLERQIATIEKTIEAEKQSIGQGERKITAMKELGAEIENLKRLDEHAKYVRRKLVKGFVADYVFQKRLIGIIRAATNQYIRAFTNGQYSAIDLEPTPARGRSGAGLQLITYDERDKARKKTGQLSFGDRTAISLSVRLGISRTMSSIRALRDSPMIAPRVRSVLLDEPLGGLDKSRRESVVRSLVNDESFKQIFLITHTDVQGWEGVPVVEVSKTGLTSNAILKIVAEE